METVTVVASRSSGLSDMEVVVLSTVVFALLAWAIVSRMRRGSQQPHA